MKWKVAIVAYFNVVSQHFLEGLRKTAKNVRYSVIGPSFESDTS